MDKPIHMVHPAFGKHVDIFVYRIPLLIGRGPWCDEDAVGVGPEFPHNSIHHTWPAANALDRRTT